jgi:hypothetical protein
MTSQTKLEEAVKISSKKPEVLAQTFMLAFNQ